MPAPQTWFSTVVGTFFMAFGRVALLLAVAGLYGVMSFAVTRRTREMGIWMALGARSGQLVGLVMRRSLIQMGVGLSDSNKGDTRGAWAAKRRDMCYTLCV